MSQALENEKFDQIIRDFSAAWRRGEEPDIDDFLPFEDESRVPLLLELIRVDLKQRIQAGDLKVRIEDYIRQFPELSKEPQRVVDLISLEYQYRLQSNPSVTIGEFRERFSKLEDSLSVIEQSEATKPTATSLASDEPTKDSASGLPMTVMHGESQYPVTENFGAKGGQLAEHLATLGPDEKREGDTSAYPPVPGYDILGVLGRGGMGVVYKARHIKLKRLVALKMILAGGHASEQDVARFRMEAEAVARLQHPNIVQIHDIGEQEDHPYFSLEFVDGGSLAARIKEQKISPVQAAELIETLARAMHFAHQSGIVHRDLKPANILLTSDGVPKITDFGLAKQLGSEQGQTRSGAVMGTPNYMAPEQARGQVRAIGPSSDVYSLGAILYELLTSVPPFQGETVMDTIIQVTNEDPVPPSRHGTVPHDLETICMKCLEKEPHRRYLTAELLADDLRRFMAHETISARPATTWERTAKWLRRHPTMATLMAACFLGFLGGAIAVVSHIQAERQRSFEEQRRFEAARAEVRDLIQRAQQAAGNLAWSNAQELVKSTDAKIDSNPTLAGFKDDKDLAGVKHRLAARATYQRFNELRDDAVFHATLASGESLGNNLQESQKFAREALQLVGLSQDPQAAFKLQAGFSSDETSDLTQGAYHLLLVLAEVVAQPQPRQTPEAIRQQARHALTILDQAPTLGLETMAYHLRRARYLSQADLPGGDENRAAAKKFPPKLARDFYLVGEEHYQQGDILEAVGEFAEALRHDPSFFWARYFLSLCYIRLGQPALAKDNLTACLSQKEKMIWIYLMRGFAHGQLENYRAADDDFQTALELHANADAQYVLYNNRAVMRIGQKQYDEAAQDLQAAIALKPNQYQAFASLSQVFHQQKKLPDAIQQLDKAIDVSEKLVKTEDLDRTTLALLYRNRSRFQLENGNTQAALADLRKTLSLEPARSPALAKAHAEIGRLLQRGNQTEEAIRAFDTALNINPESVETYRWRAEALLKLQRYDEAATGFDAYLKHGGKPTARIYQARGLAKARNRDNRAAIDDFTLALEMEPKDVALHAARAQLYLTLQSYQLALRDFDDTVRLAPQDTTALIGRAFTRVKIGMDQDAITDTDKALQIGPETSKLNYQAARVYALAAGKLEAEAVKPGSSASKTRTRYTERGLELLRKSMSMLPAEQRKAFWRDTVQHDIDFNPIRRTVEFVQLDRLYSEDK